MCLIEMGPQPHKPMVRGIPCHDPSPPGGGAIMTKLMGHIADKDGMSAGFIVPLVCFVWVVGHSQLWSKLSGSEGVVGVDTTKGH